MEITKTWNNLDIALKFSLVNRIIFLSIALSVLVSCAEDQGEPKNVTSQIIKVDQSTNQISKLVSGDQWMNKTVDFTFHSDTLRIKAAQGTDFFNNPEDSIMVGTAPFLFSSVEGDFVATALIKPDFNSQWNAAALMVYIDSLNWIKFAFEHSDATGNSIVSVVTRQLSDDANGVILANAKQIYLRMIRKGNNYSMFWSRYGKKYNMSRLTAMVPADSVFVGLEAQSPMGDSAVHEFLYFSVEPKTVENLRTGE